MLVTFSSHQFSSPLLNKGKRRDLTEMPKIRLNVRGALETIKPPVRSNKTFLHLQYCTWGSHLLNNFGIISQKCLLCGSLLFSHIFTLESVSINPYLSGYSFDHSCYKISARSSSVWAPGHIVSAQYNECILGRLRKPFTLTVSEWVMD